MLNQRHELHHVVASPRRTSLAPVCSRATSVCRRQQAAAAWAWFEHGGSTCITPSKAEGLSAAKRRAERTSAGASRFRKECLSSTPSPHGQHDSKWGSADAATPEGNTRRRHSFHNENLAERESSIYCRKLSISCRIAPNSPSFSIADDDQFQNAEEGRKTSCKDEVSSLLDKYEVEAVCRQLLDHLISGKSTASRSSCSPCSDAPQEGQDLQKAHNREAERLKARQYFKSNGLAFADHKNHHHINDVLHGLLHLRIKILSSGSSISAAPALCCSSVATVDSVLDPRRHRHHSASAGQCRPIRSTNHVTSKLLETLRNRGNMHKLRSVSSYGGDLNHNHGFETEDEASAAADQHEIRELTSKNRTSLHKMDDFEQIGSASPAPKLYHSDIADSKAFHPLVSSLSRNKAILCHKLPEDWAWRDDNGEPYGTARRCHFHQHHHFHHHHYRHLQNKHQAPQDALPLQDHAITNKVGAQYTISPKLCSLSKKELMIPPHGGMQTPTSLYQLAAKAQKFREAAADDWKAQRYYYVY